MIKNLKLSVNNVKQAQERESGFIILRSAMETWDGDTPIKLY